MVLIAFPMNLTVCVE